MIIHLSQIFAFITNGTHLSQIISEFVRNAPDATYSFLARGAEGLSELAVGLALSTYKGGQLATHITDPEKLKEIMAEPAYFPR